jgi:hypothetical protein
VEERERGKRVEAYKDYIILTMIIDVITEASTYKEIMSNKQKTLD